MATLLDAPADREEWLQLRKQRLGATDVSAVLGLNPYRTAYEVWLDKTDRMEPWEGNDATRLGHIIEPVLLDEAERRWGTLRRNVFCPHESLPIAATLDGWLPDTAEVVEIKTAGLTNAFAELGHWGDAGTDEVPEWYLLQVQVQMLVSGSDNSKLLALISGRGIVEYEIPVDTVVCDIIAERCGEWWQTHIVDGIEPEKTPAPSIDVIKKIKRRSGSIAYLEQDAIEAVKNLDMVKEQRKLWDKHVEEWQAKVLLLLGDNEIGILPDGREIVYQQQERKGYTVKPTKFRTLKVREIK